MDCFEYSSTILCRILSGILQRLFADSFISPGASSNERNFYNFAEFFTRLLQSFTRVFLRVPHSRFLQFRDFAQDYFNDQLLQCCSFRDSSLKFFFIDSRRIFFINFLRVFFFLGFPFGTSSENPSGKSFICFRNFSIESSRYFFTDFTRDSSRDFYQNSNRNFFRYSSWDSFIDFSRDSSRNSARDSFIDFSRALVSESLPGFLETFLPLFV